MKKIFIIPKKLTIEMILHTAELVGGTAILPVEGRDKKQI